MKAFCKVGIFLLMAFQSSAQESALLTVDNVPRATKIVEDEPVRNQLSLKEAALYLDRAALAWQKQKKCVTCHTNMPYLMARPALETIQKDSGEVRDFFESYLSEQWEIGSKSSEKPYEAVVVATALTFNDVQKNRRLSKATLKTLDLMWTTQREDGGWEWIKCGWAPMEIDDHFGVTLAALAVGIAPDNYDETPAASAGMEKIRRYLKENPAHSLHHRIMLAWASIRFDDLMTSTERTKVLEETFTKQLPEGGWSLPALLIDWKEFQRKDGKPHTPESPDAYGTGLAIIFAREMGIPAEDERVQQGIAWLKSNQRQSGKWFTRSPTEDSKHYITNIGTAYAVLALQACGELPGWPFGLEKSEK